MNAAAGERRWEVAHDLLRRAGSILAGLRWCYAGLQPPGEIVAPVACALVSSAWVKLMGTQSSLRFNWPGTSGNSKFMRHHADDFVWLAVKKNFSVQDVGSPWNRLCQVW